MITNRVACVARADRVIVVDEGRVTAHGRHAALMSDCAAYRDLVDGGHTTHLSEGVDVQSALQKRSTVPGGSTSSPSTSTTKPCLDEAGESADLRSLLDALRGGDADMRSFRLRFRGAFAVGILMLLAESGIVLLTPLIVRWGIDAGISLRSVRALFEGSSGLAIAVVVLFHLQRRSTYSRQRTAQRLLVTLRASIVSKLLKLDFAYYNRTRSGVVITRTTADVDSIADFVQNGVASLVSAIVAFSGMTVIMMSLDPRLAGLALLEVLPVLIATIWYRLAANRAYNEIRDRTAELNIYLHDALSGMVVTKSFARERRNVIEFCLINRLYGRAARHGQYASALYIAAFELSSALATVAVLALGGSLVASGKLVVGTLVAFLLYLGMVLGSVQQWASVLDVYQRARSGWTRISDLLGEPTTHEAASGRPVESCEIEFVDVSVRYDGAQADALTDVSLSVREAERVAIVGRTGAGKSSLLRIAGRLYAPSRGEVRLGGRPLAEFGSAALRASIAYVPQEPFLFSRSIRDNIALGRPEADDAEVETVARRVGVHDVIVRLPAGYHTVLRRGGRPLSAGERQLVCLARALLNDPAVLLLDEPTASLDARGERRVNDALRRISAGRTTLYVTHSPGSLMWVDRVLTVDDGRVALAETADEFHRRRAEESSGRQRAVRAPATSTLGSGDAR